MSNEESLQEELDCLEKMSEDEVWAVYKVDCKEDAMPYIIDYWT